MRNFAHSNVLSIQDERTVERAHAVLIQVRQRIALENRLAAGRQDLGHQNPYWRLAGDVAGALDGAVLTPERRRGLIEEARRLGMREFDANLVIAVVQDRARRGEHITSVNGPIAVLASKTQPRRIDFVPILLLASAAGLAVGAVAAFSQMFSLRFSHLKFNPQRRVVRRPSTPA